MLMSCNSYAVPLTMMDGNMIACAAAADFVVAVMLISGNWNCLRLQLCLRSSLVSPLSLIAVVVVAVADDVNDDLRYSLVVQQHLLLL